MMHISKRINILRKLAQSGIDARALPNVKAYLFDGNSWASFNSIINIINASLLKLSKNKLTVQSVVINNPNVGGSDYLGTLKNLVNLSQWLYKTITIDRKNIPYAPADIQKIISDLITTLSSQSFPEPGNDQIKSNIIDAANNWKAKLGTT